VSRLHCKLLCNGLAIQLTGHFFNLCADKQLLLSLVSGETRSWYFYGGPLTTWAANSSMCDDWDGVSCDNAGRVSRISLSEGVVTGRLPEQLSGLDELTTLDLVDTWLTGSLPEQWSVLTGLDLLDLSSNQLNGSLPEEWSALTGLNEIFISSNQLTGSLPQQWSALTGLSEMYNL